MEGVRQRGVLVDGRRLRELRRARGLTQIELAVISGVSARTIRNAEAGRPIRVDFLKYLATAVGVTAPDLAADRDRLRGAAREEENVARFLEAIQAYALNHDTGLMNEILTRDTFFSLPGPSKVPFFGEFHGIDGFAKMRDISDVTLRHERPEINDIRVSGNLVVIQFRDRGHVLPTDLPYSGMVQWVLEFDNGRLKRVDNFCDTHAIVQALYPPVKGSARKLASKQPTIPMQATRVGQNGAQAPAGKRRRGAFTLVELLVVIAIIGILVGLMMPAIQAAREASRRSSCQNHLKQFGTALLNYESAKRSLPPGAWMHVEATGPKILQNANVLLLPYLEEQALSSAWQPDFAFYEQSAQALSMPVSIFTCPSNGAQTIADPIYDSIGVPAGLPLATTDYAYSKGSTDAWCLGNRFPAHEKGLFHIMQEGVESPPSLHKITDGTCHTMAMGEGAGGERWPACRQHDCITPEGHAYADAPWMVGNVGIAAYADAGYVYVGIYGSTMEPMSKTPVTGSILNEPGIMDCRSSADGGPHSSSNFRSDHAGGGQFLFCDGSVQFLVDSMDVATYRGMSTYAGGEIVSAQ